MCLPALPAAMAIAAATTAVSIVAQNQMVKAQNRAIEQQLAVREKEIDRAATAEINARMREMRREQSRIMVAAGEAGLSLSSPSVETLLFDSLMQAELAKDVSLANRESRRAAATAEANSRMGARTSLLGAGLQIGLSAANAGLGVQRRTQAATDAGN